MGITTREIARLVGVSQQAVSSTLNQVGNSRVSADTRQRIWSVALNMGYQPRSAPKLLNESGQRNFAIIGSSQVYEPLVRMIRMVLLAEGYRTINIPRENFNSPGKAAGQLAREGVRGIFNFEFRKMGLMTSRSIPCVNIGLMNSPCELFIDAEKGTYRLIEHLCRDHGHRKIGFITTIFESNQPWLDGYRRALAGAGAEVSPALELALTWNPHAQKELKRLIHEEKVTALFCNNDTIAISIMQILHHWGVRVPEDIAVVSYGGSKVAGLLTTPLTTVVSPLQKVGKIAAEAMLELIGKGSLRLETAVGIEPEIFFGGSCGCRQEFEPELFWEGVESRLGNIELPIRKMEIN
jgi:LacI family transcriptional regulator